MKKKRPYSGLRLFILFLAALSVLFAYLSDNAPKGKEDFGNVFVLPISIFSVESDAFTANIKNYPPIIGSRIPIQLEGIDTPKIRGKCEKERELGQQAQRFLYETLRSAKRIELKNMKRSDDCFCIIARVYADNKDVSHELIRINLAVSRNKYERKKDWCSSE